MKTFAKLAVTGAAVVAVAGCSTTPQPRLAQSTAPARAANEAPYLWTLGQAPQAHKDMVAQFGRVGLKPGQYLWAASIPADGETRVVIDRLTQMGYVYKGDKLVGVSTVSTAKQGHITPLGQWTILEKRPFYRSKKYDNAPMPWMERIDEYGIALHGGGTPGFPESHGCIHFPMKFAEKLYGLTKIGTKVVIEG
jgi:lipoprotein-anchoring transpeptidase ErfK/SrfK